MAKKKTPEVDEKELEEKAKANPGSKRWNNPNSRKNLKQYQSNEKPAIVPEIDDPDQDDAVAQEQAEEITIGRKLSPNLVKRLLPKRTVLTSAERKRFNGIMTTFLSDFKNEEPTASDVDDIMEIAICDTMEHRLLEAAKHGPGEVVAVSQAMERLNKRKQKAKENLANRRSDRRDARYSQDVSFVDIAARYDNQRREVEKERVAALLAEEKKTDKNLLDIVKEESF